MKPETIIQLYSLAASADTRLQDEPMTPARAKSWSEVWLQDVPDQHAALIVAHIYHVPQMLKLQPGHITKAWDELDKKIGGKLRRARAIQRKLSELTPATCDEVEDWNELVFAYTAAAGELPAYVRRAADITPVEYREVPPLERAEPPANLKFLTEGAKK
jgi:hypothetical protein|nr:MAG TPA: hypothetical protein [Caudoviricetes sp.]